ncbi:MAG: hypothetical protein GWP03_05535, partial [Proteobacteria bacterium]|nr:hypothetical protein [Pseudomonadota bacterium]
NGDYLPIIIVRPPALKRSVSLNGNYRGLNGSITMLQSKNNLIFGNNNYNSTGTISYKKKFEAEKETITITPSFGWFQNIRYNNFSNKIAMLKSHYNIITPDSFKNVLLSDLFLNYEYGNRLLLKSHSSELLNKKIFKTNSNLILHINRYIHTSYSVDFISSSPYNSGQLRDRYTIGIRNQHVGIDLFRKNTNMDSFNIIENGVSILGSALSFSIYKKFYDKNSSINYDLSFNNENSMLRAYIEADNDTITSQFDMQFSRHFNLFYISIKGNGGNYKPYFLIPQFIESANGNYDYDSLNNVYYRNENGHFIKKLIYRQYEYPLNNYNMDFNIRSHKYFTFNGTINAKRDYIQNNDTIQKNDRYEFNGLLSKKFNKKGGNFKLNLIRSNIITSENISGELLFRKGRAELYTVNFNYNYYSDNTLYLQSLKKDFGGFFGYGIGLFNIKLFGNYIKYDIPERQNILHYGTEITFSAYVINSRFTFTPILNYNLYGYDSSFGEIDENYPKGFDTTLKLNVQHNLTDNTELNFNINMRYNEIKGFFKTFNLSVGINL